MSESEPPSAWLENEAGEKVPLGASFAIGRSSTCDLTLDDSKVSRKHTVINRQAGTEYWLSDLGSANGTYINQLRVGQPTRLRAGDEIRVGTFRLKFVGVSEEAPANATQYTTQQTIIDLRRERRWLFVADIENSTMLASSLDPQIYRSNVDEWFKKSRDTITQQRGVVNKFLGDGFLSCWSDLDNTPDHIAATLNRFLSMRDELSFRFRIVVHFGEVILGGLGTAGEESLSGPEVNFVFRMEKVAGTNGISILVSEPAAKLLGKRIPLGDPESFTVPGFAGAHRFNRA